MNSIYEDQNGKKCFAKMAYAATLVVTLSRMFLSDVTIFGTVFGEVDLQGQSLVLAVAATTYFGRNYTKANS